MTYRCRIFTQTNGKWREGRKRKATKCPVEMYRKIVLHSTTEIGLSLKFAILQSVGDFRRKIEKLISWNISAIEAQIFEEICNENINPKKQNLDGMKIVHA